MRQFETFEEAVAHVREHGSIGYQAPLDIGPGIPLPASVEPDGRIKLRFFVPAGNGWPAETYHRFASDGPYSQDNHADRLRKPG